MCLFQVEGHASHCYPSPTVWVAQGTTVVDLLCVEPGPIVCLIERIRRPTQGTGRGSSCGALVGIPITSVIRCDSEWPTEWEHLGYVCNPRSLKEGTETSRPVATVAVPPLSCRVTGSAPQRKHELMRCTCCLLYSRCDQRKLDAMIACQCPLARLVTLEVDWSLARSQFRRASDVTSPFPPSGNEGYIRNRDAIICNPRWLFFVMFEYKSDFAIYSFILTSAVRRGKSPWYNRGEIDLQFLKDLFLQDFNGQGQSLRVSCRGLWDLGL